MIIPVPSIMHFFVNRCVNYIDYSIKLSNDLVKTHSYKILNYMIKFYNFQKVQSLTANLSWGHWIEILSIKDMNKVNKKEESKVQDFIKNPVIIKNPNNYEVISERILKRLIIEDIDNNLKKPSQDKTIGIILVKKDNKFIMGYRSDSRILSKEYHLV